MHKLGAQNFNANFVKPTLYNIFSYIMLFYFFTRLFRGGKLQNKTSFVSFRVMFSGGNKNFIKNKRENLLKSNSSEVAPNQIEKYIIQNGVTLEKSYVQPICTPSRSSLMTGMDPYLIGRQGYPISHKQPTGLTLGL